MKNESKEGAKCEHPSILKMLLNLVPENLFYDSGLKGRQDKGAAFKFHPGKHLIWRTFHFLFCSDLGSCCLLYTSDAADDPRVV